MKLRCICNALSIDQDCVGCNSHFLFLYCTQILPNFLHEKDPNESYGYVSRIHLTKMTNTWREREHEEKNMISLNDTSIVRALRDCGLLRYFRLSGMRQQMERLKFLVRAWDPTIEAFHIRDKVVPILVGEIYFLIGLSRRGLPISRSRSAMGGETVRDYILQYFFLGAEPSKDGKLNIRDVHDFPLRTILFMIAKLVVPLHYM